MSTLDVGAVVSRPRGKAFVRPATLLVAVGAILIFTFLGKHTIDGGYLRRDILQLEQGEAWRTGGWLSQIVLRFVGLLPGRELQQPALALLTAVTAGVLFGAIYDRLRRNGWFIVGAVAVLVAVGMHAGTLYALTASSRAIPVLIAFGALIPAIRSIEEVGDVQSAIAMGLLLPLLLLASPVTTPLLRVFAVGAALAEPDGRRDPRAFVAMLLVALLPALIVAIGILGFLAQAGFDPANALLPYVASFSVVTVGDVGLSLLALAGLAPVFIVIIAYCFWPGLPERRHIVSALAVIALPLYLALARVTLNTTMTTLTPALALIAAFVSWLAVVRLPLGLRLFAVLMLAASAVASWVLVGLWDDPEWKAGLLHIGPLLGNFSLRPGV
jgi:hypothetical protein